MTSFFSSTFRALSVCDIFVFESCQKFIFNAPIPPPHPTPSFVVHSGLYNVKAERLGFCLVQFRKYPH